MKKNNILIIFIVIVSLTLIGFAIYFIINSPKPSLNTMKDADKDKNGYTYEYALKIANQLYKTEENEEEVKKEEKKYVIIVTKKDSDEIINRFKLDKKTGVISDDTPNANQKNPITGS